MEEKGRITIPARIRRDLGIVKGEKLVSVSDIKGIIGPARVKLEDLEDAPGKS